MLDTFRKRENVRPTGSTTPGPRPGSAPGTIQGANPPLGTGPRIEPTPTKPALLDPAPAPAPAPQAASVPVAEPEAAPVERQSTQTSNARLTVGPDIKLKGAEITDCDTLIVEGQVDASMDSRVVEIAANGVFRGKVQVDIAEIRGQFEGELTAHKQLVIRETGRVSGKIRYGKIQIDEGGEVSGDIAAQSAADSQRSARHREGGSQPFAAAQR